MRLSTRSAYGIRALIELALARHRQPLSASAIARRQGLSVPYLEQLLHRLKKHGLIASSRGPRGGYVLAKSPEQVTIAEVVQTLETGGAKALSVREGPVFSSRGNGKAKPAKLRGEAKEAHRHVQRITQAIRHGVYERLIRSLNEVTLKDLCDEVGEASGEPLDHRYVFHI